MPAQQAVQQQAKGVDVRGRRYRLAQQLLRRRIRGRHDDGALARQAVRRRALSIDELRDAEVQQLRHALVGHEDVRRFDVAVHDQVLMRVVDRRADRLEQPQPVGDREALPIAVVVEADAVDVFHDEVGHAFLRRAAVEELRDVRMVEIGQYLALALQSEFGLGVDEPVAPELDRDLLVELVVRAAGEIDHAHAARAEQPLDPVGPDHLAFEILGLLRAEGRIDRRRDRPFDGGVDCVVRTEQRDQVVEQFRVVTALPAEERGAPFGCQVRGAREEVLDARPAVRIEFNRS